MQQHTDTQKKQKITTNTETWTEMEISESMQEP